MIVAACHSSGSPASQPPARSLSEWAQRHPVLIAFVVVTAFGLLSRLLAIWQFQTQDPDDFMRLLEVRDLLSGQAWFDVAQHRMLPPVGAQMHWSRIVDLPIALALVLTRLVFAEPAASIAAMVIVPVAQMAIVIRLSHDLVRTLGGDRLTRLAACFAVVGCPLILSTFAPLRIDHHGWQAICAFAAANCLVRAPSRSAAIAAGALVATWLSISLEGLPLAVALCALYAARFVFLGDRSVFAMLMTLAGTALLLTIATRGPDYLSHSYCDALSRAHLFGLATAAAGSLIAGRFADRSAVLRAAAIAVPSLAGAAWIFGDLGVCAVNPFANLDPVMKRYWFDMIYEGLPIWKQAPSTAIMLMAPLVPVALVLRHIVRDEGFDASSRWLWLGIYALSAIAVSSLVMRAGVIAQILSLPFLAFLIAKLWPIARAQHKPAVRILATVAAILAPTPTSASAVGKLLDPLFPPPAARSLEPYLWKAKDECNLKALRALPQGYLFAPLDIGPEILARTDHTVVISGYHRNMAAMRLVVEAFSGDPANARALIESQHVNYLVFCPDLGDATVFRSRSPDNLANALTPRAGGQGATGPGYDWLEPVPVPGGGTLRVWRVRR